MKLKYIRNYFIHTHRSGMGAAEQFVPFQGPIGWPFKAVTYVGATAMSGLLYGAFFLMDPSTFEHEDHV